MLELSYRDLSLGLLPHMGGSVAHLRWQEHDILRPRRGDGGDVLDAACFPLVPFVNRIAYGRFAWRGREVQLAPNFEDQPHALHGQGWRGRWTVQAQAEDRVILQFDWQPGDWPWAYRAEQAFRLSDQGLHITLCLISRSTEPMPFSLGFHPFFAPRAGAVLSAKTGPVWLTDAAQLPCALAPADHFLELERGAELAAAPFVDNCHTGWRSPAILQLADGVALELSASSELTFLQVFLPSGKPFFAIEPMSAMPDAVNRTEPRVQTGLRVLAPGGRAQMRMGLRPFAP